MTRAILAVDEFPDFILESFADHRNAVGAYPRELYVSGLLAEIMGARAGFWSPDQWGVWYWRHNLSAASLDGIDEFGQSE